MNLDLFNNLFKSTKEKSVVQSFIKELGEFLDNNLENNERNQVPLIQKILKGETLTTKYRDEINTEKNNIINKYSQETSSKGNLYYIYNKSSKKDNTYGVGIHINGDYGVDIKVKEDELPKEAGVDSVLRVKNGKYVLDIETTEKVQNELTEMINRLLEKQRNELEEQRIEGHIYEFVEKSSGTAWLIDKTNYTGECFQEIDFPTEALNNASKGDMFKFLNGEYKFYLKDV